MVGENRFAGGTTRENVPMGINVNLITGAVFVAGMVMERIFVKEVVVEIGRTKIGAMIISTGTSMTNMTKNMITEIIIIRGMFELVAIKSELSQRTFL